jgi:hypothetical protein
MVCNEHVVCGSEAGLACYNYVSVMYNVDLRQKTLAILLLCKPHLSVSTAVEGAEVLLR